MSPVWFRSQHRHPSVKQQVLNSLKYTEVGLGGGEGGPASDSTAPQTPPDILSTPLPVSISRKSITEIEVAETSVWTRGINGST